MLLVGALARRGWLIPIGATTWAALLLATGTVGIDGLPLAALLGGANMAIGVLIHRVLAWPSRRARSASPRSAS